MTATGELKAESAAVGPAVPPIGDAHRTQPEGGSVSHGWKTLLVGAGAYLLLSLLIWSNVWHHPTSTTTCGCGDSSLFTWFIEWPAYAIAHGLNPFYSAAMNVPRGVNLPANTSVTAIGIPLAPITWLFGPVATLNVALTLAPTLSALSMFVLLRRWVTWAPAAFVGGLFYGFSPLILVTLSDAHLMLGMAVIPPLVVACLDELLFRQRRRPVPTGIVLGLLLVVQFFIGTEVLVIMVMMGVIGIVIVVVYAAWRRPAELRRRGRPAVVGLAAGLAVAFVLLVIPALYALSGPAHFGSSIWPGVYGGIARNQRTTFNLFFNRKNNQLATFHNRIFGGYQGRVLSYQYFGPAMAVVLIGGAAVWRRDRRLWLFGAIALITVVLSAGATTGIPLPWNGLQYLPILENIVPYRFILITDLAVAVMLGVIIEHIYVGVNRRRTAARVAAERSTPGPWARLPTWAGAVAGTAVAVVALVQPASYMTLTIPMTAVPVHVPSWFTTVAPHLPAHQVLLILPAPFTSFDNSMTWQALDHMDFSMVGEGGPGGIVVESGKEKGGATVLAAVSAPNLSPTPLTQEKVTEVSQALHDWGVTMVVIPDQPHLPIYDRIPSVTSAAVLMTAAIGQPPARQSDAWVWTGVDRAHSVVPVDGATVTRCTTGVASRGVVAVHQATTCVLARPGASHQR